MSERIAMRSSLPREGLPVVIVERSRVLKLRLTNDLDDTNGGLIRRQRLVVRHVLGHPVLDPKTHICADPACAYQ